MATSGTRYAPPRAGAVVEALRGLGYTTATAVADIIDNSLSAQATSIDVHFEWAEFRSWIRITDNGKGMADRELEAALQLGAKNPRTMRHAHDLGRFGMGLKTASFSQARRLTVASRRDGDPVTCLRWDLDMLGDGDGDWLLHEGSFPGSEGHLSLLGEMQHGTVVLWETVDRVVTAGFDADDYFDLADAVEQHLAMTFHRLLDETSLVIRINGRPVKAWDPFMTGHPGKALESVVYQMAGNPDVKVQCHVLPHKDRLTQKELVSAAGPAGWMSQQGFYIYRNRRLLACAGWLRLADRGRQWTRDEPHRLARIRIDIPNSADEDWKINILKSTATPPVTVRKQLVRLAADAREVARSVFAHRGRLVAAGEDRAGALPDPWMARKGTNGTTYRVARDHLLVSDLLNRAGPLAKDILGLLRLIETTVPVQRIWLDTAENEEPPTADATDEADDELRELLASYMAALMHVNGLSEEEVRTRLLRTSPFDRHPNLVAELKAKDIVR